MKNKIFTSFDEAVADIPDGAAIMTHSFAGPGGIAQNLLKALIRLGVKNLTVITCGTSGPASTWIKPGYKDYVTWHNLVEHHQVKKLINTWTIGNRGQDFPTIADKTRKAIEAGELEWEPIGQGVLAERIRAGGAGLGGFYTPVGVDTILERGKEKRVINGREYLLEMPLRADYAFIRAFKADKMGNLIYRGASRSFNPLMATAADITIAEVDEIVEVGQINPEHIITPGVFIDRIVATPKEESDEATSGS